MKLPLRFVASFLLASVRASSWPYHEIVGVGRSTPLLVAPVYGIAPAASLLPEPVKGAETVVAGPVTGTTIVEGSSSGTVTIVSPGTPVSIPQATTPSTTENATDAPGAQGDSVLIKGASAGPVTLIAPSDTVAIADNAASSETGTKKGAVAASASIESAEESSKASANASAITETIGVASAKAVIGPSTGPVIIAGPNAISVPVATIATTTAEPVTVAASTASSVSVAVSAAANASVSTTITAERSDTSRQAIDAAALTRIENSASSTSSVTSTSGSAASSATARVNLITHIGGFAVAESPLSNVVVSAAATPSAIVSGPSGTISAGSASSSFLFKTPLYSL